jgi:hypothetical protein
MDRFYSQDTYFSNSNVGEISRAYRIAVIQPKHHPIQKNRDQGYKRLIGEQGSSSVGRVLISTIDNGLVPIDCL